MTPYTWEGIRRAYHTMAEIQFAAGAERVFPVHADADYVTGLNRAKTLIDNCRLIVIPHALRQRSCDGWLRHE